MKITRRHIRFILQEAEFADLPQYKPGAEVDIHDDITLPENPELRDQIIKLIQIAYSYLEGGNFDYKKADDLKGNYDLSKLLAWDIDGDGEPDVLRGTKTKAGYDKLTVSGNDGSAAATEFATADTQQRLRNGEGYAEMSGKSASAMMRSGVPAVTDEATVRKLLPGKELTWHGKHPDGPDSFMGKKTAQRGPNGEYDGWYERSVSGNMIAKLMFGNIKSS